jgi:hypothetical protein
MRGVVRSEIAARIEAEYWRQDHNARNDNHAVQLRKLQCALPLNQSRGWAGNG